jgi:hypothetical protein
MLYVVPQLPVKNRYSEEWSSIWSRELSKLKIEHTIVKERKPVSMKKSKVNFFSDLRESIKYECNQIKYLIDNVKEGDKILWLDFDFPGLSIPATQLIKLSNPTIKSYAYCHAGSWCNKDIWSSIPSKKKIEDAGFDIFDKVFVATNYHKEKIENYFGKKMNNIYVVGFPLYKEDVIKYTKPIEWKEKKGIIVIGRIEQSNPNIINSVLNNYEKQTTFKKFRNRKEYFNALNKSKILISPKIEETFGLTAMEAVMLGTIPLCPNNYSYKELLPQELLYSNENELNEKIKPLLNEKPSISIDLSKYEGSIKEIVRLME